MDADWDFWELGEIYRDGNCIGCGGKRAGGYFCRICAPNEGEVVARWQKAGNGMTSWTHSLRPLPDEYAHLQPIVEKYRYHVRSAQPGDPATGDLIFNFAVLAALENLGVDVSSGIRCPVCEERAQARPDYLCWECRHGLQ